ncbi:hypothetical protein ABEX53_19115 [Bacillus toyonensis]|uniref:hypothetical protein n=1 Tax=Bacillus toyonensis TaxID=155322 RepID=UPI0015E18D52|nr:hypothetical protein [Bacillus toyonensis]MED3542308.1 hypothetical protein [Bacillus toyonensis]MEE2020841.1 hypothetical protein [Bacillus toyonensis]
MPIQLNSNEHTKNLKIIMKHISYKYADGNTGYYIDEPGVVWKYALEISDVH